MPAWCLAPELSNKFLAAIRDGSISPTRFSEMDSAERRAEFAKLVGEENAKQVNAQFEQKMLLKDQQKGFVAWARDVAGLKETERRDIVSSINKLREVLQPEDEAAFMSDLAARKLGVSVTEDEAAEIYGLAKKAEDIKNGLIKQGEGNYAAGARLLGPEAWTLYGRALQELYDRVDAMKPRDNSVAARLISILTAPKSALTSILHFSAPFVQGWGMIGTKVWYQGMGHMFQYFWKADHYKDLQGYILGHPDYPLAVEGKLGLTELSDKLTAREEAIQSTLLADMSKFVNIRTGVPDFIEDFSRAFTGYLNYIRFNRYTQLLDAARLAGEDVSSGSRVISDLADVVNNFTGRANLGKADRYRSAGLILNTLFFAPRKVVATMEMFNPWRYLDPKVSPVAKQAAMRQLAGSLIATGAVLTLAKVAGANVTMDPRSSDFAKVDIGGEKFDMTGGSASYLKFLARIFTGQEVTSTGRLVNLSDVRRTRADVLISFLRGKEAPVAAAITNALYGSDAAGHPFNITAEVSDMITPIVLASWIKFWRNNPDDEAAMLPAMAAVLGVGLESPEPPPSEEGLDLWGRPGPPWAHTPFEGTPDFWRNDPVSKEVMRQGLTHFPARQIRGVPLTDNQYREYIQVSGQAAHAALQNLMARPWWDHAPDDMKRRLMQAQIIKARNVAAHVVMLHSMHTDNDIVAATYAKRRADMAIMLSGGGAAATSAGADMAAQLGAVQPEAPREQVPAGP